MHNAPLTAIFFSFRSHGLLGRTGIFRVPASQMSSCSVLAAHIPLPPHCHKTQKGRHYRQTIVYATSRNAPVRRRTTPCISERHILSVRSTETQPDVLKKYYSYFSSYVGLSQYLMTIKRLLPCAKALADSRNKSQFQKQDTQGGFSFTTSDRKRGRSGRLNRHSARCPLVAIRAIKPCDIAYERVRYQP